MKYTYYQIASQAYCWSHEGWDGEYMALVDGLKDDLVHMYCESYPDILEEAFPSLVYELGVEQTLQEIYEGGIESSLHQSIRNLLYRETEDQLREICGQYYEQLLSEDDQYYDQLLSEGG